MTQLSCWRGWGRLWLPLSNISQATREAKAADAFSKSDYAKFRELCPNAESLPRPVPRAVRWWIDNPTPDEDLGRKVCLELRANGIPVLDSMC